jgi:hypothetical protein
MNLFGSIRLQIHIVFGVSAKERARETFCLQLFTNGIMGVIDVMADVNIEGRLYMFFSLRMP